MCARLLLAMPPQREVTWTEATINPDTELALAGAFDRLLSLEPAADEAGATGDERGLPHHSVVGLARLSA